MCGDRCVLFDNKTKDEAKKLGQLKQLLSLVDKVIERNGGRPYTDDVFVELKVSALVTQLVAQYVHDDTNSCDAYIRISNRKEQTSCAIKLLKLILLRGIPNKRFPN